MPTAILRGLGTGTFLIYEAEKATGGLSWVSHVTITAVFHFPPISYELRAEAVSVFPAGTWWLCSTTGHRRRERRQFTYWNCFGRTVSVSALFAFICCLPRLCSEERPASHRTRHGGSFKLLIPETKWRPGPVLRWAEPRSWHE